MATVEELLGPEQTVDDLLGSQTTPPPIKLSPYDEQRLNQPLGPTGPFGPLHPEEVLALPDVLKAPAAVLEETGIPGALSEAAADFLRRSGIDASAESGKNLVDLKSLPVTRLVPGLSALDLISPQLRQGIEERAGQLVSGLTEPGQLATLPLATLKPVMAAFALQAGSAVPGDVQEILRAQTPHEAAAAFTSAVANTALAIAGTHGEARPIDRAAADLERGVRQTALPSVETAAIRGGAPTVEALLGPEPVQTSAPLESEVTHAESIPQTTPPDGDVLHTPGTSEGPGEVPAPESGPGVPPRGPGETLPAPALAAPQEDLRSVASVTPPAPEEAIARVAAMGPDAFFDFAQGGKTQESYDLGRRIETPEQLQALVQARDQANVEVQGLQEKAMASRSMEDLNAMSKLTAKPQYFNEAYGAATGTGSAGEYLRQTDPSYRPPFPEGTATAIDPQRAPITELPVAKIRLSKDVPNFKEASSEETGVVAGQELEGKYERLGTPPIVVWRRLNGDLEVITGRHRLDLARRTGEKSIPAQVVEEARGFTRDKALTFDAEANIRDGQGSVEDYAQYFKNSPSLTEEEARARGLLSRAKGAAGWDLGRHASDDVLSLWKAGKVSEAQAVAIARSAPGDAALQRVGTKGALAGEKPENLSNLISAARLETGGAPEQLDLLGSDDSAIERMQAMAKRATNAQRAIAEQIRSVQGAAKRPELARKLGVDVGDPQTLLTRIEALKSEQARWQNWPMHPDLVDQVKGGSEFQLAKPESVEEQRARQEAEEQSRQSAAQKQNLAASAAAPLQGTTGDLGQGELMGGGDLFSPQSPKVHSMATGAPASRLRRGGGNPPGGPALPAPTARLPGPASAPRPPLGPLRARLAAIRARFQSIFSPQNIDPAAKAFSHIMRENGGQQALDAVRADEHVGQWRSFFDRTPVARDYRYDPAQPLPFNYAVMDAFERNRSALPPHLQELARLFDQEFAWRVDAVRQIKPGAMQQLLLNYFPHLWESPDAPLTRSIMAEIAAKAPFHGSKAFMRERTLPYFVDGLARGLKPMSDNPVDLLLAKMHQMDKFLAAAKTWQESRANGMLKYYPMGRNIPGDRVIVDDPAFTVFAPPLLPVREAFDAGIRRGLLDFMQKLGFKYERSAKLGVNTWGQYTSGGKVEARFGAPDFVIMHEVGHGLEERYHLSNELLSNNTLRQEMGALADLRGAGVRTSKKFRKYIQTPDEQVANAVHAYIYAPELMAKTAPNVQQVMRNIIRAHPELEDLNEIKPGLALKSEAMDLPAVGPQLAGHWTLPTGPAAVLTNYLSPGLSQWAPFRTLRAASNIVNASQLGFSGFHVGFTSLDATVSSVATGLGYLLRGDLGKAARSFAFAPVAPVANYYVGKAVQAKMIDPAATHVPVLFPKLGLGANVRLSPSADLLTRQVAELAVKGGLRATIDPFWKTQITRSLVRAWHEGGVLNYGQAALQLPLALVEQAMRPIAEYLVPRQKLGVFTQLALQEMARTGWNAPPEQVRAAMARAADWTEDRMGQMTYDNLFYNKMVKDAALMGFRAYGWQLGKYRHLYGGAADAASLVTGLIENGTAAAQGKPLPRRLEVTNRMLYPLALTMVAGTAGALIHRLFTGSNPQTLQDYFFPRTGQTDKDGRDVRLALPTYLKDVVSEAHAVRTSVLERSPEPIATDLSHKLNPYAAIVGDMWNNKDYYGVEIRHPDDPIGKQLAELSQFALKQFTPFSVSGTLKLAEDQAPLAQLVLPFIGVVPAKKALLMSPAETLAADITRNSTAIGGRTRAQFDHSQMLKTIVQDIRRNGTGSAALSQAVSAGQLRSTDAQNLASMLNTTPLEYQVGKMSPEDAMRVWRLASDAERQVLQSRIAQRLANSKVIEEEKRSAYLQELFKAKQPAPKVAPVTRPIP
jgi:hypothetical protein